MTQTAITSEAGPMPTPAAMPFCGRPSGATIILRAVGIGGTIGAATATALIVATAIAYAAPAGIALLMFALPIGLLFGLIVGLVSGLAYLPFAGLEPASSIARTVTAIASAGTAAFTLGVLLEQPLSGPRGEPMTYVFLCGYVALASFLCAGRLTRPEPPMTGPASR